MTQAKIAEQLGVAQQTLSDWFTGFGNGAETGSPDPLPPQALLDQIAADIAQAARAEVLPEGFTSVGKTEIRRQNSTGLA